MPGSGSNPFIPTEEQRQAIEHGPGPMLVVAGAGTGKTTVLARRIAHLIRSGMAKPDEILAVTYTRNAAAELLNRVGGILYPDRPGAAKKLLSTGLQATTFHAYCYALLKNSGREFQLIDDKDLQVLLRLRVAELQLRYFIKAANLGNFLKDLLVFFRRCHDELRTPDDYDVYVERIKRKEIPMPRTAKSKDARAMSDDEIMGRCHEIARVFRYVEELLKREDLGTYGHILTRAVDLLGSDEESLHLARKRARFILIDEFQDSNVAQIKLAQLLADEECNVFAVGDPDQAIYRFRGATAGAFDQFLRTFGPGRVRRLMMSQNRRSTPPILRCAYQAITCNPEITSAQLHDSGWKRQPLIPARLAKEPQLVTAPPVEVIVHSGPEQEAEHIADAIENLRRKRPRMNLREVAVLYSGHKNRQQVLDEFRSRGIPFQVKGVDLFSTPEVRDAIAGLRVLYQSDPIALFRVATLPQFHVDAENFRAELALAGRNASVEAALDKTSGGAEVLRAVREARAKLAATQDTPVEAIKIVQGEFHLPESKPLARLRDFCIGWCGKPTQIAGKCTLGEFLEYLEFFQEAEGVLCEFGEDDDVAEALGPRDVSGEELSNAVQMMTIHGAKGLEFQHVFVLRIVTSSLPRTYREPLVEFPQALRSPDTVPESDPKSLFNEEERRLFYVAITRAKDHLHLYGKAGPGKDLVPSKFLRDLTKKQKAELAGAVEHRVLQTPLILSRLHAAAEPLPVLAQWLQLPPRPDARLCDLSASAIEQYKRCPLAYKLGRDWNIPEAPMAHMQFGSAMHLALKAYFDSVSVGRPLGEDAVVACFLDEFGKAKIEEQLQRDLYEKKGREELVRLLSSELATPEGKILESERRFKIQVGDAAVVGRMDRLDHLAGDEVAIVDYKTGRAKSQQDADDSLQLSIYALAAKRLGMKPGPLVFINLDNGVAVASQRSAEQIIATENQIIAVAQKIAGGEFAPKPDKLCRNCSYFSICPAQEVKIANGNGRNDTKVN